MNEESGAFYNTISLVFLILTVFICISTVAILSDTVRVPDSLSPATAIDLPTLKALSSPGPSPTSTEFPSDFTPESTPQTDNGN